MTAWFWSPVWIIYLHLSVHHALAENVVIKCELGDTVFLQPNISVKGDDSVRWSFNDKLLIKDNMTNNPRKYARSVHGDLVICRGHKNDSGSYKVEIFKRSGTRRKQRTINLTIEGDHLSLRETQSCNNVHGSQHVTCEQTTRRGHLSTIVVLSSFVLVTIVLVVFVKSMKKTPSTRKEDANENIYQEMHGNLLRKTPTAENTTLDPNSSHYDIPMRFLKKKRSTKRQTVEFDDNVYV
ncbi:uncharacterized protein LOC143111584 isoform X2 [Alosa pseudoharengus]|uniref:uncharacterized protein LOC143111584 isoform X2 n=1 Tax=Alosa pseudoharengus TaxID=34774 RepID=UPI003F8A87C4